jgi:DNA invertase Pin-like site-specific DNA recombinase
MCLIGQHGEGLRLHPVSTFEQSRSGLGLAAQRDAIDAYAKGRGWSLHSLHEEVASGAKSERPVLDALLASLGAGDTVVVARLDRLTRSLLSLRNLRRELGRTDGLSLPSTKASTLTLRPVERWLGCWRNLPPTNAT